MSTAAFCLCFILAGTSMVCSDRNNNNKNYKSTTVRYDDDELPIEVQSSGKNNNNRFDDDEPIGIVVGELQIGDDDDGPSGTDLSSAPCAYTTGFCQWKHMGCYKRRSTNAFFSVHYVPRLQKTSSCLKVCYLYVSFALPHQIYAESDGDQCYCHYSGNIEPNRSHRTQCVPCKDGDDVKTCGNKDVISIFTCDGSASANAIGARKRSLNTWTKRSSLVPSDSRSRGNGKPSRSNSGSSSTFSSSSNRKSSFSRSSSGSNTNSRNNFRRNL